MNDAKEERIVKAIRKVDESLEALLRTKHGVDCGITWILDPYNQKKKSSKILPMFYHNLLEKLRDSDKSSITQRTAFHERSKRTRYELLIDDSEDEEDVDLHKEMLDSYLASSRLGIDLTKRALQWLRELPKSVSQVSVLSSKHLSRQASRHTVTGPFFVSTYDGRLPLSGLVKKNLCVLRILFSILD